MPSRCWRANAFEEIDYQPASSRGGTNYGWAVYEGNVRGQPSCALPAYAGPVAVFQHTGGMCAVVGGYVYRGTSYPALSGIYLFADWCTGRIFGLVAAGNAPGQSAQYRQLFEKKAPLPSFGEDEAGELYVFSYYEEGVPRDGGIGAARRGGRICTGLVTFDRTAASW